MSSVSFGTKSFVLVIKQDAQLRPLYSTSVDDTSRTQHLIRDSSQFSKGTLAKETDESIFESQLVKCHVYDVDGYFQNSLDQVYHNFSIQSICESTISLAVDLGISSSVWLLGRHGGINNRSMFDIPSNSELNSGKPIFQY